MPHEYLCSLPETGLSPKPDGPWLIVADSAEDAVREFHRRYNEMMPFSFRLMVRVTASMHLDRGYIERTLCYSSSCQPVMEYRACIDQEQTKKLDSELFIPTKPIQSMSKVKVDNPSLACRYQLILDGATMIPRSCERCDLFEPCKLGLTNPLRADPPEPSGNSADQLPKDIDSRSQG